ncbi:MAG: hypothetical protein NVS3B25_31090 [Hymenobacter sp.]
MLVILEQNYAKHSWFKLSNNKFLTYWGTYTYGLYCLHPIVLDALLFALARLHVAPILGQYGLHGHHRTPAGRRIDMAQLYLLRTPLSAFEKWTHLGHPAFGKDLYPALRSI